VITGKKEYGWKNNELRLNGFSHYAFDIEGQPIHFIHEKGKGKNSHNRID
jgi:Epoxide hydrolase N terminus